MKKLLAIICVLALLVSVAPLTVTASADTPVKFAVLSTTDMHGRCWDRNPLNDASVSDSMLNVSTAVKSIREEYGANVILVDNGDLYQGTPISSYQLSLFAQDADDKPAAMALCLAEIGYDAAVPGNHEFNYDWDTMSAARQYLTDRGVSSVCANLYYDGTGGTAAGQNVFTPYITKDIDVNGHAAKIGILGLENTDCTRWDVPDNYPNIVFAHPDNTQMSMAWEVDRYVPQMQAEGCDFIIVSMHFGLGSTGGELIFGTNTENQAARTIAETEGVDMVITGHDHSTGYSNTYVKNKNNEDVLVVNGGGSTLTKSVISVTYKETAGFAFSVENSENLTLKNFAIDTGLKEKTAPYAELAEVYVNQVAGTASGDWDGKTDFYLTQTDTIDLINRSQIAIGSRYLGEKYDTQEKRDALYAATGLDHIDVDMSSTSVVVNGNYTVRQGDMTVKDIYKMCRYDSTLYLLPLTGRQIKDILEQNASTRLKARVKNGAVTYSTIGEDFTNLVFGGVNFTYDMALEEGSRALITGFDNGKEFDLSKTYIVGVNSPHLGNTGCGFKDYTASDAIWSQTDDLGGGVVQDLIYDYIHDETEMNGSVTPHRYQWSLSYSGSLDAPEELKGDLIAKKLDAVADGDEIVIYYDADSTVITANPAENTARLAAAEAVTVGDLLGTAKADAAVFTVEITDAEARQFALRTASGNYLTSGETGNSLGFNAELTDCGKWYLKAVEGGFHIMNVDANYNGNYNQALEWNTGFTTYGEQGTAAYLFNLYKVIDTATLATEVKDGSRYVIYYDAEGTSLSDQAFNGGLSAVTNTPSGSHMPLPLAENTLVVTAHIADGKIDFVTADGKHLTSAPAGNGLSLTEELAENDCGLWTLVAVEGGWHVMNVGANHNGNYNQALEWCSKFTTYGVRDTAAYLFNFYELPASDNSCELGHTWDAGVETTPASCTETGVITFTCTVCGETKTGEIEKLLHAWDEGEPDTFATCINDGVMLYTCTVCGETRTEPIAAYGHSPGKDSEDYLYIYYICDNCGERSFAEKEPPAFEDSPSKPFSDLKDTWYRIGTDYVISEGIMGSTKTGESIFEPNTNMSRAMLVSMLYRFEEATPVENPEKTFTDVPADMWYTDAVLWAANNGIVNGTGDGTTFSPNAEITREQIALMLYNFIFNYKHIDAASSDDLSRFSDADSVSSWALVAVKWAVGHKLISDREAEGGTLLLAPKANAMRCEVATLMMSFAKNVYLPATN